MASFFQLLFYLLFCSSLSLAFPLSTHLTAHSFITNALKPHYFSFLCKYKSHPPYQTISFLASSSSTVCLLLSNSSTAASMLSHFLQDGQMSHGKHVLCPVALLPEPWRCYAISACAQCWTLLWLADQQHHIQVCCPAVQHLCISLG